MLDGEQVRLLDVRSHGVELWGGGPPSNPSGRSHHAVVKLVFSSYPVQREDPRNISSFVAAANLAA
jgi:hypothetical protein